MTRDLQLRGAQATDLHAIAALLERCGLHAADIEPLLPWFHVAAMDGRVVGCAGAERYGKSVVVRSVAVLPEYRDRGIASHLVQSVLTRARADGCRHAVLLSASCPSYFARYGFSLVTASRLPPEVLASAEFHRDAGVPALCMQCVL